jgi:hypothetical protein
MSWARRRVSTATPSREQITSWLDKKGLTPGSDRIAPPPGNAPRQRSCDQQVVKINVAQGVKRMSVNASRVEGQGFHVLDFWVKGGKRNRMDINQELQIALGQYLTEAGHGPDQASFLFLPVKSGYKASDT